MLDFSFCTTLQNSWPNTWIPSFGMVLIQFLNKTIFKDDSRHSFDFSPYNSKKKLI